jgi:pilus assembly protein CpaB
MHVDILISGNTPGGDGNLGTLTKTLLQNIEVLSAGQDFKKDNEGKPIMVQVVNLLVTPQQAEQLSLASNQTTIQLILRNPLDHEISKTTGTALRSLFTGGRPAIGDRPADAPPRPRPVQRQAPPREAVVAPPPAPKDVPFTMEIISGNTKSEKKFSTPQEAK